MFGKGKINITIQRTNYAPGDTISGTVALTLKKPVKAREVSISLIGTGKQPHWGGEDDGPSYDSSRLRIYEFKLPLGSEKEYSEGREYRFEIRIPADILSKQLRAKRTHSYTLTRKGFREVATPFQQIKWYLLAKLDIPGGLDISKKVYLTIG